ncbi:MAG: hypothetical protein RIS35_1135, partial [Pseudomonadota bacterium]|jgi:uncharacterized protein (TIGR02099 family)
VRYASIRIERPRIVVERASNRLWRIAGLKVNLDAPFNDRVLDWVLAQHRIVVRDARIDWRDRITGVSREIPGVQVSVIGGMRHHRVSVGIGATEQLWRKLEIAADLQRGRAEAGAWLGGRLHGEVKVGLDQLEFAGLGAVWPLPAGVPGVGRADVKLTADFSGGHLRAVQGRLSAPELGWGSGSDAIVYSAVELEAGFEPEQPGGLLRVERFTARLPGGMPVAASGEQRFRLDAKGRPIEGRVALQGFDVGEALAHVRTLRLPAERRRAIEGIRVEGRVTSLVGRWSSAPASDGEASRSVWSLPADYEVAADFERVGFRPEPAGSGPAFSGLSGQARISPDSGELRIKPGPATLDFPGVFPEPLIPLDSLSGEARWTSSEGGPRGRTAPGPLRIDIADLRFSNADAAGTLRGSYTRGGRGPGIVDLQARLTRAEADRVVRYLPKAIPDSVRGWVAGAVTAGRSDDVRLRLRGDLADFPFRNPASGDFSVVAQLRNATLRYAPGWPAIERFEGNLAFERGGMRVGMRSGRVFDVQLGRTEAVLPDLGHPTLTVEGTGEGPASDMIRFVNQSPVATRIDDFTRDTSARGSARLSLRLELPLADMAAARVAGSVTFRDNELRLDKTVPPLSGVNGTLAFSERGLALEGISATFLGGPLRVEGETPEPGYFRIRAEGSVAAEGIRSVTDNPLTRALSGRTGYRASIDVRRRASTVLIESGLEGLGAALPRPFEKPAGAVWPLRVRVSAATPSEPQARPQRDSIRVELRDDVRIAIERERDPKTERLLIRRAGFAMRSEPVLPDAGLSIALRTGAVDADAWLALLTPAGLGAAVKGPADGFAEGFSLLPRRVSVVADRVRVGGKDLNAVVLGASRVGENWLADIASREITGSFGWKGVQPGGRAGTLTARFSRLEIPRSQAGEVESLLDTPPTELPALDISADEFVLFDRRLGRLALKATNGGGAARPVWTLNELRISNPHATFSASGTWAPAQAGGGRSTRLTFELGLIEAGGLLDLYGVREAMRGGAGTISGELHWNGSPLSLDYPTLGGDMSLALGRGQFLKTDPGIAKLIGVLNLQSLPRRLSLDFRDVFAEGFSFDRITGDVGIARGVARTENLLMRGVQAQVRIRGSADIAAETQSLDVDVRPELNAGLASIAYGAIVNPVVGLGSFIAQLALSNPIQQIFSYEFEVSGSWADPQVIERRRITGTTPAPTTTP